MVAACLLAGIVVPDGTSALDTLPLQALYGPTASRGAEGAVLLPATVWTDVALPLAVEGPPPEQVSAPVEVEQERRDEAPAQRPRATVRDRALGRLADLGATPWQLTIFDCIGWHESGWRSIRSERMNSNGTYDHGPFQINQVHYPKLNALGLDPYVPEDAAVYAWMLSSNGTNFTPWSVHAACGV